MSILHASWVVALKDLRLFFRDRTGLLLGFLLPIALVTVFGFVMQVAFGGSDGTPRVRLWVADADGTEASAAMMAELRKVPMLAVRPGPSQEALTADTVRAKVEDGEGSHALILTEGFAQRLAAREEPEMILVRDPGRGMEDQMVRIGVMQAFLANTEGRLWPVTLERQMREIGMSEEAAGSLRTLAESMSGVIGTFAGDTEVSADTNGGGASPGFDISFFSSGMVPLVEEDLSPPDRPKELTYMLSQSISGVSVMMLLFGMMAIGSTLLQEREEGTLQRILASGMPRDALLWGKALAGILVGVLQLGILLVYGGILFQVDLFHDPVTLAILIVCWASASVAFGLVVATWARTRKQAEGLSTLLILVMAALGGCWFPIQMATDVHWGVDVATHSTITYWAMSGFQNLFWRRAEWLDSSILVPIAVQVGFTVVALACARALYRRRFVTATG